MKKSLFLVLISLLLIFSLVACGEKEVVEENNGKEAGYKAYSKDAQFAAFAQEFGDFKLNFEMNSVNEVMVDTMMNGIATSNAQQDYLAANGIKYGDKEFDEVIGYIMPASNNNKFKMNETVFKALRYDEAETNTNEMPAYVINDMPEGYGKDTEFYDNANGKEVYYITGDGMVFTLPGYPRTMADDYIRFYITPNHYYSLINESTKTTADTDENGLNYLEKPITADDFTYFEAIKK